MSANIAVMRGKSSRVRGLLQRYRIDRRLPPSVLNLFRSTLALKFQTSVDQCVARIRPTLGSNRPGWPPLESSSIVRHGNRRLRSAGRLRRPYADLTHEFAASVIEVLQRDSLDPFIVGHMGNSLHFGVPLDQRDTAIRSLASAQFGTGWYLDWVDGLRTSTVALECADVSRSARRSRSWRVYRVDAAGDLAAGPEQAVELSFWDPGTSGELELVGTRGPERFDERSARTVERVDGREYPGRTAFPVGESFERFSDPVDIVYTWVDGADANWRRTFELCARDERRSLSETALDPARYHSRDELKYSLRSVWANCGWARNIYIVTAGQMPRWLVTDERVKIIDHTEILPSSALPTFNSHAIEAALHRIDGLSEHFIYFNDDMFIGRPVQPDHFFTPNGLARVFSSRARIHGVEDAETLAVDTGARRGRELLSSRFGRVVSNKPLHSPYPLRRSVMEEIDEEFPDVIQQTTNSRFRSPTDLSVAASFAQHYGMAIGKGVFSEIEAAYVHVESARLRWHLAQMLLGRFYDAFCINETSHVGTDTSARELKLSEFFEAYFPVPSPWERTAPQHG